MDILLLDENTRRASALVEGWDSFIWTERYIDAGEFKLVTKLVTEHRLQVPLGSYISIRGSSEPMRVENHLINKDEDDIPTLTMSGRTLETILEDRCDAQRLGGTDITHLWSNSFNGLGLSGVIAEILKDLLFTSPVIDPSINPNDLFVPEVTFNNLIPDGVGNYPVALPLNDLYDEILKLLNQGYYGLRGVRPGVDDTAFVMELYQGVDRRSDVIFRLAQGHIKDSSYLFTIKGQKNIAYVFASENAKMVPAPGVSVDIAGLARKVLTLEVTDTDGTLDDILTSKGLAALAASQPKVTYDGEVVPNSSPYLFGRDYGLGDIVQLEADYDFTSPMMVTEYIRSQDDTGEKSYPTLVQVT